MANAAVKGIALIIFLAILIFIIWCFILGKCKGHVFGMIPPYPSTSTNNRKKDQKKDGVDVSGSGSGSAGSGGSGGGGSILTRLGIPSVPKFPGQAGYQGGSPITPAQKQSMPIIQTVPPAFSDNEPITPATRPTKKKCEGLDPLSWFFCHVQNGANIVGEQVGKIFTPAPGVVPVPRPIIAPLARRKRRQRIIVA